MSPDKRNGMRDGCDGDAMDEGADPFGGRVAALLWRANRPR
jgi:hypothetical protein